MSNPCSAEVSNRDSAELEIMKGRWTLFFWPQTIELFDTVLPKESHLMRLRPMHALALLLILLLGFVQSALAQSRSAEETFLASVKNGPMQKLGPWLANLYDEFRQAPNNATFESRNPVLKVRGGRVAVDLYANDPAALQTALGTLGATTVRAQGPLVSALVPVRALGDLAALPSLAFGNAALAAVRRAASQGSVVSQGDIALGSDNARASEHVDGSGATVGVLSDSYGCNPPAFVPGAPTSTAAADKISGDVPADVQVLSNGPCPGSDEGRGGQPCLVPGRGEVDCALRDGAVCRLRDDAVGEHVLGVVDHVVDDDVSAGVAESEDAVGEVDDTVERGVELLRGTRRDVVYELHHVAAGFDSDSGAGFVDAAAALAAVPKAQTTLSKK